MGRQGVDKQVYPRSFSPLSTSTLAASNIVVSEMSHAKEFQEFWQGVRTSRESDLSGHGQEAKQLGRTYPAHLRSDHLSQARVSLYWTKG